MFLLGGFLTCNKVGLKMTGEVKIDEVTLIFDTKVFFTNILIAGGRRPKKKFLQVLSQGRTIFCADSGVNSCYKARLKPKLVVGDLDSAKPKAVIWAKNQGATLEKLNPIKDDTDFKVLLDRIISDNSNDLICTGVFAGRFDHFWSLFNYVYAYQKKYKRRIILADQQELIFFLDKNGAQVIIEYHEDIKNISLLPLANTSFVSISGVKWPLQEKKLEKEQPFSISNQLELGKDAHLCLHSGCVAVYIQR